VAVGRETNDVTLRISLVTKQALTVTYH